MSEAPEDYLDDDERELTQHSKDEIEKINEEIGHLQEDLEELDSEVEREVAQDRIDELEELKEDIKMDDDNYEYTEDAKDEYVERRMDEVRNDPVGFLRDFGMEESIKDFIDEDDFIEGVIESDGRGHTLSSYDGTENEISFDDEWYYIYRTN
jgi:DNA repair exonuclease SbcCD ATPase subunit